MIELRGLRYAYPECPPVLVDIDLRVEVGERVVLLGSNGCGKSTLLKILAALLPVRDGEVRCAGHRVGPEGVGDAAALRDFRRRVGLLFQNPDAMLFNPTVYEEIAFGPRQLNEPDLDARVRRWARLLDLESVLDASPFRLSGGQKQKLCLASLLVMEPELLLLDEPTANLDPRSTGWLVDFLQDLSITTVVSTHNLSLALELGSRAVVLGEEHRIVYDGPVEALREDLDTLRRANLVHRHRHRHGDVEHRHDHFHDWD